jgi:hypothetical protein
MRLPRPEALGNVDVGSGRSAGEDAAMSLSFRAVLRALGVALLASHLAVLGCGFGGAGDVDEDAFTTIILTNVDSSASIVEADFDFSDVSGIENRVEPVFVMPGFTVRFGFDEVESDAFVDVTLTWSDATTTTLPLLFVSGGEFPFPVSR